MKTLGLEKILIASSIWESFLSRSSRLFCTLRVSARTGSISRSFTSCSWPAKNQKQAVEVAEQKNPPFPHRCDLILS